MGIRKAAALLVMVMIGLATMIPPAVPYSSPHCPPPPSPKVHYSPKPPSHSIPTIPGSGYKPGSGSCPLDALKLGACVDLLGGLVHVGLGDPVVNQCCPLLKGIAELEAALCLCTTISAKLLNLNIILPLALELFVQCGMTPPRGFTCPPLH